MSITNDLIELNGNKSDIQDALVAKGVATAGKHGFNKFAEDITSITNQYTASDEGKVVSSGQLVAQTSTTATANGTINTTTNNEVVVNVPNTYTAGDEGKVVSSGSLVAQTAYPTTITENGTYNTTENNSVTVNVASTGKQIEPLTITNSHFSAQNIFILYDSTSMDIYGNCNVSYMSASDLYATYQSDIDVSRLLNKNVMMGGTSSHMKFKISSIDTTTKTITLDTSTGSQNFQTSVYAFASYT